MRRSFCSPASRLLCGILTVFLGVGFPHTVPSLALAQQTGSKQAKELIEDGIKAYQDGHYAEAVDRLTQARSVLPSHSPTALYLGLAYLRQGKTAEAIVAWQEYVTLPPYTDAERKAELPKTIPQYLTLLFREENHRTAHEAVAREQVLGPGNPQTVAITYYRNFGSPAVGPLQKGLTALLINDISKVPGVTVVERDRLQALLEELQLGTTGLVDQKTAPKVGRLLGAGRVATGSYLDPTKDELRVDSLLAESTAAQILGTQQSSGRLEQFYELEKHLALLILRDLGYDEQQLQTRGVLATIRQPQTTSLVAFTAYSNGLDAKDRGDYTAARTQFEQAVATDPNFELAKRELLLLPLLLLTSGGIVSAVERNAPSASASTAGMAGGWGISGTRIATVILVITLAAVGIMLGLIASNDDKDRDDDQQTGQE